MAEDRRVGQAIVRLIPPSVADIVVVNAALGEVAAAERSGQSCGGLRPSLNPDHWLQLFQDGGNGLSL